MSEPIIYTRNYIDSESEIYSTPIAGNYSYIFDSNKLTKFVTSGANSDSTHVYLGAYFNELGDEKERLVDTIILSGYNWKEYEVSVYINGSGYQSVYSTSSDTQSTRIISITPTLITAVYFDVLKTKTPNEEKSISEIVACAKTLECPDFSSYDPKWRERSKEIVLGDGSVHKVYTKDASGRLCKYEASVRFNYLSKATRDSLKAIKETGEPFLWQPESVTVPEDIYYVHWSNTWDEKYMSNFKSAGYEVIMNLKEV